MSDILYVLTNESMPGLVKIGITDDLRDRMRGLYRTGVPVPFECHYAVRTEKALEIETKLKNLFRDKRINPNREFFKVDPERVVIAISIGDFEVIDVNNSDFIETTPQNSSEAEGIITETDVAAAERAEQRRSNLKMSAIGINPGEILCHTRDDGITCTVLENNKVLIDGQELSLSAAAAYAFKHKLGIRSNTRNFQGPLYWIYEGETLSERRIRIENEEYSDIQ